MENSILLYILLISICTSCSTSKKNLVIEKEASSNTITFEVSPYGLIFTDVIIKDEPVKAMIDFGDPNILQLSSTYVENNKLEVKKMGGMAYDIKGNAFEINSGTIDHVQVGSELENQVSFSSSPGEMESVSKQIGTDFHAVVGWGYFKEYFIELDYANRRFNLKKNKPTNIKSQFSASVLDYSSYLVIPVEIDGQQINALLDTGSPVTVIDKNHFSEIPTHMSVGGKSLSIDLHHEDLSMLADLNVKAIIGGDFMSKFIIHIFPSEKQIIFE